jgi:formamidopyrimidine-DNA glycosylase
VGKKKAVSKNDIEGLVIPNKWDEKGKIIGIAIHTDKEEMFIVAHNRMEGELLNQLHIKVKIEGRIMERLDGNKLIHVRNFQPILDETNYDQEKQPHKPLKEDSLR